MPDIKEIIRKRKMGDNSLPLEWQALLTQVFKEFFAKKEAELEEQFGEQVKEAAKNLEPKIIKELKAAVLAAMPIVRDGHTPTKEELLAIITPLIPKVRDGKDSDPEDVATLIFNSPAFIKKLRGEDGKTPSKKELKALIKPLMEECEGRLKRVIAEALRGIQSATKGASRPAQGGGMGNWKHEQFAISSATTSVTLATSVAASGMAHMVRYQGQMLAYGVQYTISGRTVTLLFTPDDSTVLDVTYVRT